MISVLNFRHLVLPAELAFDELYTVARFLVALSGYLSFRLLVLFTPPEDEEDAGVMEWAV